jgi:hypothetical protein
MKSFVLQILDSAIKLANTETPIIVEESKESIESALAILEIDDFDVIETKDADNIEARTTTQKKMQEMEQQLTKKRKAVDAYLSSEFHKILEPEIDPSEKDKKEEGGYHTKNYKQLSLLLHADKINSDTNSDIKEKWAQLAKILQINKTEPFLFQLLEVQKDLHLNPSKSKPTQNSRLILPLEIAQELTAYFFFHLSVYAHMPKEIAHKLIYKEMSEASSLEELLANIYVHPTDNPVQINLSSALAQQMLYHYQWRIHYIQWKKEHNLEENPGYALLDGLGAGITNQVLFYSVIFPLYLCPAAFLPLPLLIASNVLMSEYEKKYGLSVSMKEKQLVLASVSETVISSLLTAFTTYQVVLTRGAYMPQHFLLKLGAYYEAFMNGTSMTQKLNAPMYIEYRKESKSQRITYSETEEKDQESGFMLIENVRQEAKLPF